MKNINNHIKENNFSKAYLLFGDEDYLKSTYKKRLINAISGDDTMNLSYYEGKDIDVQDVVDTSNTLPFFADKRLIVIENSGFLKNSSESIASAIKNAPESTCFIFVENEVDKRNKTYKALIENGYVCEMKKQTEDTLMTWAAKMFKDAGKKITRDNMAYFLAKTGNDMNNIKNEADKIIAYTGAADEITMEDIDLICTVQTEEHVFAMIDSISEKNKDKVMRLYSDLVALKEPPMKILALLGRQFATLMAVKEMAQEGHPAQVVAEKLGIRSYYIGKYISQSKSFTLKQLRQAVEDCVEADYSIKSGLMTDTYAVELVIMKYSG